MDDAAARGTAAGQTPIEEILGAFFISLHHVLVCSLMVHHEPVYRVNSLGFCRLGHLTMCFDAVQTLPGEFKTTRDAKFVLATTLVLRRARRHNNSFHSYSSSRIRLLLFRSWQQGFDDAWRIIVGKS